MFKDRAEAGRRLASAIEFYADEKPLVLALPRGGVPVAYEIAERLDADMDVVLVRKIGAPFHEELAIGAVVDGLNPTLVLNEDVVREFGVDPHYIAQRKAQQLHEIERRARLYRGGRTDTTCLAAPSF
jgi:putative phosphoribosyl transferase